MDGTQCAKRRMWRWRSNPLRRRDDVVEAWIALAVWVVAIVGGTLVGMVTAGAADEVFVRERNERHPVTAVLLTDVPKAATSVGPAGGQAVAKVRWTADDGTPRTGETLVARGRKAGAETVVWVDRRGALAPEPPSPTAAAVEAGVLGSAAALALAGAAFGVGAAARWRLDRRRVERWGREWEQVGPQWRRQTL
ncbi:Rv1733c family protein [Streptomyces sp. NPDC003635]